jgi:hypothetical protein
LLIAGAQTHDILAHAAAPEQNWQLQDRQVFSYIAAARAQLEKLAEARQQKALGRQLVQRADLYARALSSGDTRTALACLDSEAKLLGLFAPVKIAPTTPDGTRPYEPVTFTDAERAAALQLLYARLGAAPGGQAVIGPEPSPGPLLDSAGSNPFGDGGA